MSGSSSLPLSAKGPVSPEEIREQLVRRSRWFRSRTAESRPRNLSSVANRLDLARSTVGLASKAALHEIALGEGGRTDDEGDYDFMRSHEFTQNG